MNRATRHVYSRHLIATTKIGFFVSVSAFVLTNWTYQGFAQTQIVQSEPSKNVATQESATKEKQAESSKQEEVLRWQKIRPETSGFQIQFPGEPKHVPRTVKPRPDLEVSVDMYTLSIRKGKVAFLAGFHDVQELPTTDEKRKEILDGGIKGAMVNVIGELTSHEVVTIGGRPARKFSYRGFRRGREVIGHSQLILVNQRVFQVTIIHLANQELDQIVIDQFFTSFQLDDELIIESEAGVSGESADK